MRSPIGPSNTMPFIPTGASGINPHFCATWPLSGSCSPTGSRIENEARLHVPFAEVARMNDHLHRRIGDAATLAALRGELDLLEEALAHLRAARLRQLAASRSRRLGNGGTGPPARGC